jgi:hypothetical protein
VLVVNTPIQTRRGGGGGDSKLVECLFSITPLPSAMKVDTGQKRANSLPTMDVDAMVPLNVAAQVAIECTT